MNTKITFIHITQPEEPSPKRRYLNINEEIYVEDGKYLIPLSEIKHNQELQTEVENKVENNDRVNLEMQNPGENNGSIPLNDENSARLDEDLTRTNSKDTILSETKRTDSSEGESSDDLVIVTNDGKLLEKDAACVSEKEKKYDETSSKDSIVSETNCSDSSDDDRSDVLIIVSDDEQLLEKDADGVIEKKRNIRDLINLIAQGERSNHLNTEKSDPLVKKSDPLVKKSENKTIEFKDIPTDTKIRTVPLGANAAFPIKICKKRRIPAIETSQADFKDIEKCMKNHLECPYCNFKVSDSKMIRHIIARHIISCFCEKCNIVSTLAKRNCYLHHHRPHNLICTKCLFKTIIKEDFHRHLISTHLDIILDHCGICGESLEKKKLIFDRIQTLQEHVNSKHLKEPEESI